MLFIPQFDGRLEWPARLPSGRKRGRILYFKPLLSNEIGQAKESLKKS
jgi:hypothetical protein